MATERTILNRVARVVRAILIQAEGYDKTVKAILKTHDPIGLAEKLFGNPEIVVRDVPLFIPRDITQANGQRLRAALAQIGKEDLYDQLYKEAADYKPRQRRKRGR
jgi:hypothetical protein